MVKANCSYLGCKSEVKDVPMACACCRRPLVSLSSVSRPRLLSSWLSTLLLSASAASTSPTVASSLAFHFPSLSSGAWSNREVSLDSRSLSRGGIGVVDDINLAQRHPHLCRYGRLPVLASMAPGAGVMAQEEDGRTSDWGNSLAIDPVVKDEEDREEDMLVSPVLIKVIGVGGGGGNAVDGMISTATRKLAGVQFLAMNTDTQALTKSLAEVKIALGSTVTRGLGAGGKPEVGEAAATESLPEIEKALAGADMVFVTAGMGGGTGTGAAPVIAATARSMGCVTVAVVTEPFEFEGRQRSRQAAAGLAELRKAADTVLVVANDKLLEIVPGRMTMSDAFLVADDVLRQGVIGTSELIVRPGLINVDFADVREVITSSGTALIGIGTGSGKSRAEDAAVGAIVSPLLEFPIDQASGVIFNIVGGLDMSLTEVNAAASIIQRNVHPDANIIIGALVDERCGKQVSVTVLATGFALPGEAGVNVAAETAAEARTERADSIPTAAAAAAAYEEGSKVRRGVGGAGSTGAWAGGDNDGQGGYASVSQPAPRSAAPGRPSFDAGGSQGQASSKIRANVYEGTPAGKIQLDKKVLLKAVGVQ